MTVSEYSEFNVQQLANLLRQEYGNVLVDLVFSSQSGMMTA
jgi:hypothetical protein